MKKQPFVLSGGGARGFAHVGVAQALRESGIEPEAIAATSAGALVGGFLAGGMPPEDIRKLFIDQIKLTRMLRLNSIKTGLFTLQQMGDFLTKYLPSKTFEGLEIPFFVTATNFETGKQQVFNSGDLIQPVLAACSIPAIFPAIVIDGVPYVDGGLSDNLPTALFADRKQEVIAVHVNPLATIAESSSIARIIDRSWLLSTRGQILQAAEGCAMFIEPPGLAAFGMFDAHKLKEIYEVGYAWGKRP